MTKPSKPIFRRDHIGAAVSVALALIAHDAALAQQSAPDQTAAPRQSETRPADGKAAEAKPKAPINELETVLVVGTRQSQQSAISRKKHGTTAQDSIVAEDVGAFPDRNIGEAISRIAGVALDRGDFGEGVSVSIRGNGPELTRVELDGMSVRSGGGTNLVGDGDGRGTEFRELSSDLIKSVDVVKGSTAAMTEGSLGGGIIIQTRTGLDFPKPFYSLRVAGTQSSLNKDTTPNLNLVAADKFLDKRLGVIVNLNSSRYKNERHQVGQGGSNNEFGLVHTADLDNSPEKTFIHNPATLAGATINTPLTASPLIAGGFFNSATPVELLTKSAAAQTKADCFTAFPTLTTAQLNTVVAGSSNATRNAAYTARQNEQLTCLNQWNDYMPSPSGGFRYNLASQDDKRTGGDIRLDFKVSDELSVYGKYSANKRHVDDTVGFLGLGSTPEVNVAGTFVDNTTTNIRTLAPSAAGYLLLPGSYTRRSSTAPLVQGATINFLPGYTVDANHHLTSYTPTGGTMGTDTIFSSIDTDTKTLQFGGEHNSGRLKTQFMVGSTKSTALRFDRRASFSYNYGNATYKIGQDGIWGVTPASGDLDSLQLANMAGYSVLTPGAATSVVNVSATNPVAAPAYTAAQRAAYTSARTLQISRVFDKENTEKTLKLDLSYNLVDKVPFLTSVKGGLNYRNEGSSTWNGAGGIVKDAVGTFGQAGWVPAVYMQNVGTRYTLQGCQDTAGSLATNGQPCAYGYVANPLRTAGTGSVASGTITLTPAQYQQLVTDVISLKPTAQYFGGAKNRSAQMINGWNQIDIDKLFQLAGVSPKLDCLRSCTASDGKVYDMPVTQISEKVQAGYLMTDFEVDRVPFTNWALPFGMEIAGNFGVRVVKTDVKGTGNVTFRSVVIDPTAPDGTVSTSLRQNTEIAASSTDVMPSLNLSVWAVPDKVNLRYSVGKTVARPPVSKLLANGITCTYSEVVLAEELDEDGSVADQGCNGTMGNPALKPQTNVNHNLSLEWYANRDSSLSFAVFRQRGLIGAPTLQSARINNKVFANSTTVDPATGKPLRDVEFSFQQWDNQAPSTRDGVEFGGKTAFTFLPSVLRYTGMDANFTIVRSKQGAPTLDLISGRELPIKNEPKHSYNASLWYDDGALQARVATQVVAQRYRFFSPDTTTSDGINNYPSVGIDPVTGTRVPYNPGSPGFSKRTAFIDAKVSYRFKNGIELFADVRNLTGETNQSNSGGYQDYADGIPYIYSDSYNGRRWMVGMTIRSPK